MVDRVEAASLNRQQSAGGSTTGSVINARDVKAWRDAFEFVNEAEKQIAEEKGKRRKPPPTSMRRNVPEAMRMARRRRPASSARRP